MNYKNKPKKILIFGGGGFVGGNLASVAHHLGWEVFVANRTLKPGLDFATWNRVDITADAAVASTIDTIRPDLVVNLAALAAIDTAEVERELAWAINVQGAKNVTSCCAANGIRNIYFSSDAVFDGEAASYLENSQPDPVNYYGQTKAEAEKVVLEIDPNAIVVRISLVLGFPVTEGNAFFAGLAAKLEAGQEVPTPKDEVRTPVDVITLSEAVLELAESDFSGIIHIGSTDSIDRFSLTCKIVQKMGYPADCVVGPARDDTHPDRAARHRNGVIAVTKAQKLLTIKLLRVDESILRAFEDRISPVEV
jgi:dTDP-4-dehydrorhamnose reductase